MEHAITLDSVAMVLAIIVQLVGLGIALGALRQTVRSLREIADATLARLGTLECRVDKVEDRTTRLEVTCELRHHPPKVE